MAFKNATLSFLITLITLALSNTTYAQLEIHTGAGSFSIAGGKAHEEKNIEVFYYRSKKFSQKSPIVIVMPGAGRNGDTYRDKWMLTAEKYGLLVLSPSYSKKHYPGYKNYNLAKMTLTNDPEQWLFSDLDRLFERVKKSTRSTTNSYDFFGHSAGGQFGHRMAIFYPQNKARVIIAANSGWYTDTAFDIVFPYGLREAPSPKVDLKKSFSNKLVILLGELDNENETRGHLRKTPEANAQGAHRLARGKHFYTRAKQHANDKGYKFSWDLAVVPGVGHQKGYMGIAAAKYLYDAPP